jgi:peptidoglycan/LPS O-acetylase OafA/YrhL
MPTWPLTAADDVQKADVRAVLPAGRGNRIHSLDGLRAVSIGLVLLSHTTGAKGFIGMAAHPYLAPFADLGVTVFFVISGFLITGILLREIEATGHISLSQFYFRRTLRIFPPFYFYIGVMFILRSLQVVDIPLKNFLFAATYTHSYAWVPWNWLLGHTWSLAVEEQFYLLWPGALVLLGTRRAFWLLWALVGLCPLLRSAFYHWQIMGPELALHLGSHAAADSLALGCLLAFKREWLHGQHAYMRVLRSPWFVLIPLVPVGIGLVRADYPLWFGLVGASLINVCIVLSIDWCVTHHKGRVGRVLNSRPLVFVGLLSYSLYLWQQPFLRHDYPYLINAFPLNLALAFACALFSYHVVERYSLKLRENRRLVNDVIAWLPGAARVSAIRRG